MKKPSKAFSTRYEAAKRWRREVEPDLKEVFIFCAPGRQYDFTDSFRKQEHEPETYTSLGEDLTTDLASDLVTYFTPAEAPWASYLVTTPIEEDYADAVIKLVTERENQLRDLITQSNYNDVAPQWGFEAAAHGTPALWVSRGSITEPIHVEVVPPHELYVTCGYKGRLDRFRRQWIPSEGLEAALTGLDAELTDNIRRKMDKPGQSFDVVWGYWHDWSDPGRPMWRMEVTVDDCRVTEEEVLLGDIAGNCPLLVGRFNPQPGRPWGRGAGRKALPDFRVLDKIEEVVLTGLDDALQRTIIYPDDGFLDLSEGLTPGMAYPANRGFTRDSIYEFPRGTNLDYGFFTAENFEERLRQAFYQDGPRQRGDTPPTATQWLDERRRIQQRIGKPSAPLWSEMILPLIQRFEQLAVEAGEMEEAITHNERAISVIPISPLQKAQNNDKVMVARSNLDLAFSVFREQTISVIDPVATFKKVVEASGDELTVVRNEQAAPPQGQ